MKPEAELKASLNDRVKEWKKSGLIRSDPENGKEEFYRDTLNNDKSNIILQVEAIEEYIERLEAIIVPLVGKLEAVTVSVGYDSNEVKPDKTVNLISNTHLGVRLSGIGEGIYGIYETLASLVDRLDI